MDKEKNQPKTEPKSLVIKARFVRVAPDKIRYAAKAIIGKELESALAFLEFSRLGASRNLALVLKNARSQAKEKDIDLPLYIQAVAIDVGPKLKRRRIIHRGRATTILKRTSHIMVVLKEQPKLKVKAKK